MGRRSRVSKAMALLVGLTWLTVAGLQASWAQETQSSGAAAPPSLTLRQAIDQALGKNPEAAVAQADLKAATAGVSVARTGLLPRLNFAEDISRGNDPVYVFGTRLRQQQFTSADFALNSLNKPTPVGNFATRFSGQWMLFNWFGTQEQIHGARFGAAGASAMSEQANQGIVLGVVEAYQAVLYAQRRVDVAQHEETTAEALLADAKTKVHAGLAVDSDMLAAQVNLSEQQEARIAAEGDADVAWAQLEAAMGADTRSPAGDTAADRGAQFSRWSVGGRHYERTEGPARSEGAKTANIGAGRGSKSSERQPGADSERLWQLGTGQS